MLPSLLWLNGNALSADVVALRRPLTVGGQKQQLCLSFSYPLSSLGGSPHSLGTELETPLGAPTSLPFPRTCRACPGPRIALQPRTLRTDP